MKVIKSKRKSISVEVNADAEVIVRAPRWMSNAAIVDFLEKHREFIERNLEKMERRREALATIPRISEDELKRLAEQAKEVIPQRVAVYASLIGVTYHRITIRNQRTRWGSCSTKGNLNFNVALMKVPPQVLDYVVVHELCHRLEMNHSARFWERVGAVYPEYKIWRKWLKDNGSRIMAEFGGV
ncbi:MAG: M48 family metallopeptidase [Lachnospiraceae bacterium]|nr:M48 family metallopeptidase [Lachnospiraceae bacterium]